MNALNLLPENLPDIQAHIATLGWIPPDARLANPRPAGEGNMNRTLLVDCEGTGAQPPFSIVLKQAVPFVAKYPDIPAPIERGAAETAFYRAVQANENLTARMPRLLGTDPANHLLAFSYLEGMADMSNAYSDQAEAALLPARMPALLDWLGTLHSAPAPENLANLCMRELNHTHIFDLPLQAGNGLELGELQGMAASFAADDELKTAAARLGDVYLGAAPGPHAPVLLHGDFYPGSWLASRDSATNQDVFVIDPEFAFVGPAEFDVGVCLAHLQFAGLPYSAALECFKHYPGQFDQALADGFAGMELIRRLLGVAQLPLAPETATAQKLDWLGAAREQVVASAR